MTTISRISSHLSTRKVSQRISILALGGGDVDCSQDRLQPQTLHDWVKKAEVDSGQRAGVPTDMAERLKGQSLAHRLL